MRAVLYARVSTTDKQDPEVQLAELREYASRRGWELCGTFVDRTSGSRESRAALDEVEGWPGSSQKRGPARRPPKACVVPQD